jgi:hypothetical protein
MIFHQVDPVAFMPGPGAYLDANSRSGFAKATQPRDEYLQFFGSRVERLKENPKSNSGM